MNYKVHVLCLKYKKALKEFSILFNQSKPKERYLLIRPMWKGGFTLKMTQELGFNATKHMWISCRNKCVRNKGLFNFI
jgi:hypothetical protein